MPRRLALPLAIATALAMSACASGGAVSPPTAGDSGMAGTSSESAEGSTQTAADQQAAGQQSVARDAAAAEEQAAEAEALVAPEPSVGLDDGEDGLPEHSGASVDDVLRLGGVATWIDPPARIALSLPASSGCWALAGPLTAESATALAVQVEQPQVCGAPDAARTYVLQVPADVDADAALQLTVTGLPEPLVLTLPAP
ncbi:hypothetical protein [Agrococcus sp. BE272]|uniref:hypothetical protein n=1 Tax=Agrococcus sp. BE272 TaxID=2817727 RepID=UPI00285E5EB3|nr:hypothetical protein [Agrococcus sp. BE272]MDR7233122.1 hypothetical protein [Agrococcus sp. BE272]